MPLNQKNNSKFKLIIIIFLLYINITRLDEHKENLARNYIGIKKEINNDKIKYMGKTVLKSNLLNDYLSKISSESLIEKEEERNKISKYFNLSDYSNDSIIQSELKYKFLGEISKFKNQKITQLETFYLSHNINFGNGLILINNAIFFCEVVGCNLIILNKNQTRRKWLIIKTIFIEESNITIMQGSNVDCQNKKTLCIFEIPWLIYYPIVILPQVKTYLIKAEILSNLPKVDVKENDLYIHIRGGDIFQPSPHKMYAQPPLCFYEKIINKYIFNNIYIISMDRSNIIIRYDISLLCHSFNIVVSVSSFAFSAIKLNDNLKELWEYDIMRLSEKFLFLHHHITKFKKSYQVHTMRPSDKYKSEMFSWKISSEQIKLMIDDKCPYDFVVTKPNI